jgi:hypothetical protein
VYHYVNGNIYRGTWLNDKKHGQGVYIYAETNEKYEGEWLNGARHGRGTFTYIGGVYEGGFVNNNKEGWGKFSYFSGAYLEGQWKADRVEGEATMTMANGDKYTG